MSTNNAYLRGKTDAANGVYNNPYPMSKMTHFYYEQGQADYYDEEDHAHNG